MLFITLPVRVFTAFLCTIGFNNALNCESVFRSLFGVWPHQVLDKLESMHGTLRERLMTTESTAQRALANSDGHLDFVESLRGLYGTRWVQGVGYKAC